jgi:3-methyladenine DNA glycosylase AlkC
VPTLLKDLLSPSFVEEAGAYFQAEYPNFDAPAFQRAALDEPWPRLELKQRIRRLAETLNTFVPADFTAAAALLGAVARRVRENEREINLGYLFLPDYVEVFGLDHYDASVGALEEITQLMSAEFAVRPLLRRYPQAMLSQMIAWSRHEQAQVRRLASEGVRPRLPWGMGLPALKKDPRPILPILENLKTDPVDFVRRSVANNLNDISKDHPELALSIARRWRGISPETDWIVKHACRGLLKKGNPGALALFGYRPKTALRVARFQLAKTTVRLGESLAFAFDLVNEGEQAVLARVEYAVYFRRANGAYSRKVFMIAEREFAPRSVNTIKRAQHFRPITTRRYHAGEHRLAIVLNGMESEALVFSFSE